MVVLFQSLIDLILIESDPYVSVFTLVTFKGEMNRTPCVVSAPTFKKLEIIWEAFGRLLQSWSQINRQLFNVMIFCNVKIFVVGIERIWRFCSVFKTNYSERFILCSLLSYPLHYCSLNPIIVLHSMSQSRKVQNKLFSVSCLRLGALTLLVDDLFYLTSALIESYIP